MDSSNPLPITEYRLHSAHLFAEVYQKNADTMGRIGSANWIKNFISHLDEPGSKVKDNDVRFWLTISNFRKIFAVGYVPPFPLAYSAMCTKRYREQMKEAGVESTGESRVKKGRKNELARLLDSPPLGSHKM